METFLWAIGASLVVGLAKVAWSTPKLYNMVPTRYVMFTFLATQGAFQIWNAAIRKGKDAAMDLMPEQAYSFFEGYENLMVPSLWWGVLFGSWLYLLFLYALAHFKIQHDSGELG